MEVNLAGKAVFVTGGGIGFGRQFALRFAAAGAAVAVTDIDLPAAERVAETIRGEGGRAVAIACDVADEAAVRRAADQAAGELGGVDYLINNAGRHLLKYNQPFGALTAQDVRDLLEVNLMGVIFCTLALRDAMAARGGGAIVNIASIAGHMASTPYGVSKLAVRGLTMAFACELSDRKIRVNAISPGLMATENALKELPDAMVSSFVDELQLVHRLGAMDDIVDAALFLCSPAASFITGQTLMVSGGYPMSI